MSVDWLKLILSSLVALVGALFFTPPVKSILKHFEIVDKPSSRRINKTPIPRGGGIALIAAFAVAVIGSVSILGVNDELWSSSFAPYAISSVGIIVFIGIVDDIRGLKPFTKLVAQIAAACIVFSGGASFGHLILFSVPTWLDFLITLAWFVIIVNAFNLVDGLDGLASGIAFIGACGMAATLALRGNYGCMLTLFCLAGACLGFLRYNYNPASIFLGDTGSLFIGFILALSPLVAGGKAVFIASVGVPLLVVGLPIFDTILAILRRSARAALGTPNGLREVVMPDVEHLHHRLLSSGINQRRAAWILYSMSLALVLAAIGISVKTTPSYGTIVLGLFVVVAIIGRQLTNVEMWYVGNVMNNVMTSLPRKLLAVIYVVLDIVILFIGWYLAADLVLVPHIGLNGLHLLTEFPVFLICILASFSAFRVYWRRWDFSQTLDYFVLAMALFIGWLVAYSLISTFTSPYIALERQAPVFLALVAIPLLAARMARVVVRSLLAASRRGHGDKIRVIVYGSEIGFYILYTLFKYRLGKKGGNIVVSAVVDDNPKTIGSYIHGFRVHDLKNIDKVANETGATAVVVTKGMRPKALAKLFKWAGDSNISLKRFNYSLKDLQ